MRYSLDSIKKIVNKMGEKSSPSYTFVQVEKSSKRKETRVKIKNSETKEVVSRDLYDLKRGRTPWKTPGLSMEQLEKEVNKYGKRSFPNYRFVESRGFQNGLRLVKIENLNTKQTTVAIRRSLVRGHNPWNMQHDRHEKKVIQPKFKSLLKGLGLKVETEVKISARSRVDFVCTTSEGRKIIVEVKSHKKNHGKQELTSQISKYKTDGKKKYGNLYAKTYLTSVNGRYGYSISDLKKVLKQDGLI